MKLQIHSPGLREINLCPAQENTGRHITETPIGATSQVRTTFEKLADFSLSEAEFSQLPKDALCFSLEAEKPAMRLLCVLEGSLDVLPAGNRQRRLQAGSLALFSQEMLSCRTDEGCGDRLHFIVIGLPENYLLSLAITECSVMNKTVNVTTELLLMAAEINRCPYDREKRMLYLQAKLVIFCALIMALLCRTPSTPGKNLDYKTILAMLAAREIIDRECEKPYTLQEILKRAGLEDKESRRAFRELFGMDVTSYLPYTRLAKSFRAVVEGKDSLEAIALTAAYNNVSNYIAAFKKFGSATPSALRKHYQQKSSQPSIFFVAKGDTNLN